MTNFQVTPEQSCAVNPYYFVRYKEIKNEQGIPLSFRDRPFLKAILEDKNRFQCVLKAPQIGMTVLQLVKSMWWAYYEGKDIIYTLPTESDVQDMAGGKINRIIAQNPPFLDWIKEHDTVSQKTVGRNIIYYRGTFTQKAAMMVTSQLNIHDEVDASNPTVITQYETRLQAQPNSMRWYFSHPSVVGAGIDVQWQKSDQKEWFVHCNKCDEWQFLEWPQSINQRDSHYQCKYCEAEISDQQRREGHWRKLVPDAEYSGYHISQLMCPWIPASKIIKDFKEKDAQYFYNFVLALPYADAKSKVTLETIKGLLTENGERQGRVIFGVDTGIKIRWVVGDMNGLFDIGECESYEELQRVCDRYNDWIMVMDKGGDIIGSQQFQLDNKAHVFLCYFQQDKQSLDLIKWHTGDDYGLVSADRNRLIQMVVDEMNDKRIPLYGNLDKWWGLWTHWQFMYRIVGEDRMHNLTYVWECDKAAHRNDWALAMCYFRIGTDRFAQGDAYFEGGDKKLSDYIPVSGNVVNGKLDVPTKVIFPEIPSKTEDWRFSG